VAIAYKAAIDQNRLKAITVAESHYALGEMCDRGEGIVVSPERAAHHYMIAADRHNNQAQWKLANMFEVGRGVGVHEDRAVMYFKRCARGGNEAAHLKVETYLIKGQGVEHPRSSSAEDLETVAERGNVM